MKQPEETRQTTELVDLVDRNGQVQVVGLPREEACANTDPDLYVPIAVAVVFNGLGEVLVQQRSWGKPVDRGRLDFVCGIVSSGEAPAVTAVRESQEEADVAPLNLELIAKGVNKYRRYRYLFVGETNREGVTVQRPNKEVEWAALISPVEAQGLLAYRDYEAVGDFEQHLTMAANYREVPLVQSS